MKVSIEPFGHTRGGELVNRFNLENNTGMTISLISYGATLISLRVPDSGGRLDEVVLGFNTLEDYESNQAYIGAIVGRFANRISYGRLQLDGKRFQLSCNEGKNQLHGGFKGLNNRVWHSQTVYRPGKDGGQEAVGVEFNTRLEDGLDGYPGNLDVSVQVWLTDDSEVQFEYRAITDKTTVVNITHHGYFNLSGRYSGNSHHQLLQIDSDYFTPVDAELIPLGELKSVTSTAFDFRIAKPINQDSGFDGAQPRGFDHNWVLNKQPNELKNVAQLADPLSGRLMQVWTTQPGLQFYAGQYLDIPSTQSSPGFVAGSGICLETQHFPDSPNQLTFPDTSLRPGEQYAEQTIYKFGLISS